MGLIAEESVVNDSDLNEEKCDKSVVSSDSENVVANKT
jgi:hypothetical protein